VRSDLFCLRGKLVEGLSYCGGWGRILAVGNGEGTGETLRSGGVCRRSRGDHAGSSIIHPVAIGFSIGPANGHEHGLVWRDITACCPRTRVHIVQPDFSPHLHHRGR
jgi:hypothetical protein